MGGSPRVATKQRRDRDAVVANRGLLAVCGLTVLALVLRLPMLGQSLFGDELYTYEVAIQNGLGDVFDAMRHTEANPPLYYLLGWVAAKLADPTVSIRVPALVFGTASVPLVYVLGLRTVGQPAALIGAALLTLTPFAIFYSSEARAYAGLVMFACLSTYALLRALDGGRMRWWAVFCVATSAAAYSHYTAVFPLAAQLGWALWARPDRRRETIVAYAVVGLSYLPWLPSMRGTGIGVVAALTSLTPESVASHALRLMAGHPFVGLERAPGDASLVLLGLAGLAILAGAALTLVRRARAPGPLPPSLILLLALAAATPVGVVLYSAFDTNILLPRNLFGSLPAIVLLVGWVLASIDRRAAVAGFALILAALAIGTAKTLGTDLRRPPYDEAAAYIDAAAHPGDPVVEYHPAPAGSASAAFFPFHGPFDRHFELNLERGHRQLEAANRNDPLWREVDRAPVAFVVMQWLPSFRRQLPRFRNLQLVRRQAWDGSIPVAVLTYRRR